MRKMNKMATILTSAVVCLVLTSYVVSGKDCADEMVKCKEFAQRGLCNHFRFGATMRAKCIASCKVPCDLCEGKCTSVQVCNNTNKQCVCKPGFQKLSEHSACTDTCYYGYKKNSADVCTNIDECKTNQCKTNQTCEDKPGYFQCSDSDEGFSQSCKDNKPVDYCKNSTTQLLCENDKKVQQECNRSCGLCGKKKCHIPMDVLFILDKSSSITDKRLKLIEDFVEGIVDTFEIGRQAIQVGILLFAINPHPKINFTDHLDINSLKKAILEVKCDKTECSLYGTHTENALTYAKELSFTPDCGSRKGVKKVAVVMTDGKSSNPAKKKHAAEELKNSVDTVITVGVGSVNDEGLQVIASGPHLVFKSDTFEHLLNLITKMSKTICPISDIDECKKENNPCGQHSKCTNTVGWYLCGCEPGYVLKNGKCQKKLTTTTKEPTTTTKEPTTTTKEPTTTTKETTTIANPTTKVTHDIVFLVDTSWSINAEAFVKLMQYVEKITKKFHVSESETRVGLIRFNSRSYRIFDFKKYTTNIELAKGLDKLMSSYKDIYPGSTKASKALKRLKSIFGTRYGGRPGNIDVCVVVWDGMPDYRSKTIDEAKKLKAEGVYVISVGVNDRLGVGKEIASPGLDFHVADFDHMNDVISDAFADKIEHAEKQ